MLRRSSVLAALFLVSAAAGHAAHVERIFSISTFTTPGEFNNLRPLAVDASGNVYAAGTGSNQIQKFNANGNYVSAWGTYQTGNAPIDSLAVDSSGNVWLYGYARAAKFSPSGVLLSSFTVVDSNGNGVHANNIAVSTDGATMYAAHNGAHKVYVISSTGGVVGVWGSTAGSAAGQFNGPNDVAVDAAGNVYVGEIYNKRIQKLTRDGVFVSSWNAVVPYTGKTLYSNYGLAVSTDGFVYVGVNGYEIQLVEKFDTSGNYLTRWEPLGSGAKTYGGFGQIGTSGDAIYAVDTAFQRVQKFHVSTGAFVTTWGKFGRQELPGATSFAISASTGVLAVRSNGRTFIFDLNGNYLTQWGDHRDVPGTNYYVQECSGFVCADGVAIGPDGYVYVTEWHGIYNTTNGGPSWLAQYTQAGVRVSTFNLSQQQSAQFAPESIAVSSDNYIYAAEWYGNRIVKVNPVTQVIVSSWGATGSGNGQFSNPSGIAVSTVGPAGYVYVMDYGNYRVQKFDLAGNYVSQWGSKGKGNGQFDSAADIAVDGEGSVYVAGGTDLNSKPRVQKFTPNGVYLTSFLQTANPFQKGLAIDKDKKIFVVGMEANAVTLAKYSQSAAPTSVDPITTLSGLTGSKVGSVDISWTWPQTLPWAEVAVSYSTDSSFPFSYAEAQYKVDRDTPAINVSANPVSIGGLDPGTVYYFKAWVRDAYGNYSDVSNLANATPKAPTAWTTNLTKLGAGVKHGGWISEIKNVNSGYSDGKSVATDSSGNVYITGAYFNGENADLFLRKHDSEGNVLWTKYHNGAGNGGDEGRAVAVDGLGNVIVVGHEYRSDLYTGTSPQGNNVLIRKYDSSGKFLWSQSYDSYNGNDHGNAVAVDGAGNIYVGGQVKDYYSQYLGDVPWIAKYNGAGLLQWATSYVALGQYSDVRGISLDASSNVYVAGQKGLYADGWVAKYNNANPPLLSWTTAYNGAGNQFDIYNAVAADGSGNVYVGGFENSIYSNGYSNVSNEQKQAILVRKFDANGLLVWTTSYLSLYPNGAGAAQSLALDASGNVFAAGIIISSDPFQKENFWLAKYGGDGSVKWTADLDNESLPKQLRTDTFFGLALDSGGNAYAKGYSQGYTNSDVWLRRFNADAFEASTHLNALFSSGSDTGLGVTWDAVASANYAVSFSSKSDFSVLLASGALGANTTAYSGLDALSTTYYFRVKLSTEGIYNVAISTRRGAAPVQQQSQQNQPPPAVCEALGSQTYSVSGAVRNPSQQGIVGVQIQVLRPQCPQGSYFYSVLTNDAGEFNLSTVATGTYVINFFKFGYGFTPNFLPVNTTQGNAAVQSITGVQFSSGPQLNQVYDFVQTSTTLMGGTTVQQFFSTSAVKLDFGGIAFNLPPNQTMGIISETDKLILNSSNTTTLGFGNQFNFQVPPNINVAMATTTGGAFVFKSTGSQVAMSFGNDLINFKLPPGFDTQVQESVGGGVVLKTSGSAHIPYGANFNIQMPPTTPVNISTNSVFAGGWVFNSSSSAMGLKFAGEKIFFKLPPGLDTSIKENTDGLVFQTTSAAQFPYGNSLNIQLPAQVNLDFSTGTSVFPLGAVMKSSAQYSLGVGSGNLVIPPLVGLDFWEKANGRIVLRSTAATLSPIQWGGAIDLALPPSVNADLTAKSSSSFVLLSTAVVPMISAGMSILPSSGSFEAKSFENLFSVTLQTDSVASCSLVLPTTAQKILEVGLSRRGSSTGTVSLQIVPGALNQNVNIDVKLPSSIPSITLSTAGGRIFGMGNDLAIEINPGQSVTVSNSTGVPVNFSFQDADLAGRSWGNLRVGVYNTVSASWEILPTIVDGNAKTATAYAAHFSLYQLMSLEPLNASADVATDVSTTVVFTAPKGDVTLDIPAGSFSESVTVVLSTPSSFPSVSAPAATLTGLGTGVEITLSKSLQPQKDVTITVGYQQSDVDSLSLTESRLILARYDTTKAVWVPLVSTVDATNNKITAKTNHFSTFQIMQSLPSSSVGDAKVFPNPFMPGKGHASITFAKLPEDAKIKIYTLTGVMVRELSANASGLALWDGKNDSAEDAASGVYFVLVSGTGGKKTLKVAIQR